jgi:serine/threonine-protein kinase
VIKRDGEVVEPALWSTAMPLDPGGYTIEAEAPGYVPWRSNVVVSPSAKRQVISVPQLARAAAPVAPVEAVPPPVAAAPAPEPVVVQPAPESTTLAMRPRTWSATRKLSVGLAVVGVGAIAGGVYFGVRSSDLQDQADDRCPLTVCADSEGLRLNRSAQDNATRANVLYVAGGAAVATATVLWFVGKPSGERVVKPTFSHGRVGVAYAGSF